MNESIEWILGFKFWEKSLLHKIWWLFVSFVLDVQGKEVSGNSIASHSILLGKRTEQNPYIAELEVILATIKYIL